MPFMLILSKKSVNILVGNWALYADQIKQKALNFCLIDGLQSEPLVGLIAIGGSHVILNIQFHLACQ